MGLFFKKKRTNSVGENLDRLTPDGELPFGWIAYNKEIVNQIDDEVSAFSDAVHAAKEPRQKIAAIKSYFMYLEDGKKHYSQIGECVGKYFTEYICDSCMTEEYAKKLKSLEKVV